jgi:competence protein ComEC
MAVISIFLALKSAPLHFLVLLLSISLGVASETVRLPSYIGTGNYQGIVRETKASYFLFSSGGNTYYVSEKGNTREVGDILLIKGRVVDYQATTYEGRYDIQKYFASRGVYKSIITYETNVVLNNPLRFRSKETTFLSKFSSETSSLMKALLFNEVDYSSSIISDASSISALFFLSSSGLLYSLFLSLFTKFLSLGLKEKTSKIIALVVGAFFLPFSLSKIGIWRVFLSLLLGLIIGEKSPESTFKNSLIGILFVFFDHLSPLRSGFLLGFSISYFMSFSSSLLNSYAGYKKKIASRILLFSFLLPLYISRASLHLLAPLYSFIFLPLIVPFGLLSWISFLSIPFLSVLNGYAGGITSFVHFLSIGDLPLPLFGVYDEISIFLYYLCLFIFLYLSEIGFFSWRKKLALILGLVCAINAMPLGNAFTSSVTFINVGQGDGILIRDGYTNIMIDTGGNLTFDMAQEVDIPYLRKERIYHLDYLIASHSDFDHIGAKDSLLKNFSVRHFIDSATSFPLAVGNLNLTNYNVYGGSESNDKSLVIGCQLLGRSWLFTGDAPKSIEEKIVKAHPELRVDILKVGHHGSDTSSSEVFLRSIKPKIAIISVGLVNLYKHPSSSVITLYKKLEIPYRETSIEGSIKYEGIRGTTLQKLAK